MRVEVFHDALPHKAYHKDSTCIPSGLYIDADGDVVLVCCEGQTVSALLLMEEGLSGPYPIAWPIYPAPAGTRVVLEA